MSDLVERMEEERRRLSSMLKETGAHPATAPILKNAIEFMIERIGYWQSEVIRQDRQLAAANAKIAAALAIRAQEEAFLNRLNPSGQGVYRDKLKEALTGE